MSVVVVRWECGNGRSLAITKGCGKSGTVSSFHAFHQSVISTASDFLFAFSIIDLLTVCFHLRDIFEVLLCLDERECMAEPLVLNDGSVVDALVFIKDAVGKHLSLPTHLESSIRDYRQGYYAAKEFKKFTTADKERQLEDALMLPDPITELTIAMELDYFQLNRAEYFVPVAIKIPGRELALAKRGGSEHTLIDFVGEIKDSFGTTITNLRDSVDIKLTDATAIELAKRPIQYDCGFTLLPGKYTIKVLARDNETGRIGTYQTSFTVPNLNRETERVRISSVVLGSQRLSVPEALYNSGKNKIE
jgi:hypothetical protein